MSKVLSDKNVLLGLCKESYSYSEVLRKLNLDYSGSNYRRLKAYIKDYDIDISHFTGRIWKKSPNSPNQVYKPKYDVEDVLIPNSPIRQKTLRNIIRRKNLIPYRCSICGCDGKWQGGLISLELDHIDGDNHNNTLSNLRYLCPNCHAMTPTYRGKNKHNKLIQV